MSAKVCLHLFFLCFIYFPEVIILSGILKFGVIGSLVVYTLIILVSAFKTKRFLSCLFLGLLQGTASLFAVNALGLVTGLHLSLNSWTLAFSAIGGAPAVIGMVFAEILFT